MQEWDKRYEACVKHHLKGVLHMAYFDELDAAWRWVQKQWSELPHDTMTQNLYGAAVFDQEDGRRIIAQLGAHDLFQ